MNNRTATIHRQTKETDINVSVNLDGSGNANLDSGIPFLDHMLHQIAVHGLMDLDIHAKGDLHIDAHHTVEDIGITLGQALAQAWSDKRGINRYGHAYVPLDEALSRVVLDCSGRPGLWLNCEFAQPYAGQFEMALVHEFFQGLTNHAMITLHMDNLRGSNAHHQCETLFKAFARALRMATAIDSRLGTTLPSSKGKL